MKRLLISMWMLSIGIYCYSQAPDCTWQAEWDTTSCAGGMTSCFLGCPVPPGGAGTQTFFFNNHFRIAVGGGGLSRDGFGAVECMSTCNCEVELIYFSKCQAGQCVGTEWWNISYCERGSNCLGNTVWRQDQYFKYCY